MKTAKQYILSIALSLGILFGVSSLQAGYTAPTMAPPNGNAEAPINVGDNVQTKLGQLRINTQIIDPYKVGLLVFGKSIFNGNIEIGTTTSPATVKIFNGSQGSGKVLTSDDVGNATWQTPTGGGGGGTGNWGNIFTYHTDVNFVNGVSDWITISLPSGNTMTAAAVRYGGLSDLTTYMVDGQVSITEFMDMQAYVEVDQAQSRVKVHLINNNHITPNTTYDTGLIEIYLTIFTGSPSGGSGSTQVIDTGLANINCAEYAWVTTTAVSFNKTFTQAPKVFLQSKWMNENGNEATIFWVTNVTTTGFNIRYGTPNSNSCRTERDPGIMWMAIQS
ncbi:MAG: H-type lectin domain-containing protein [Candidatus Taylorbacteria bacterium]